MIVSASAALPAGAQEVRLKLHHYLPAAATIQSEFIEPWARRVEAESDNRIKIDIFPLMQLGGKPPALLGKQSARDGSSHAPIPLLASNSAVSGPADVVGQFTRLSCGRRERLA